MTTSDIEVLGVLTGALIGSSGMLAWFKLRPDNALTNVNAAQGAVLAQSEVVDTLKEEIERLTARVDILEKEREVTIRLLAEREEKIARLEIERERLQNAIIERDARISGLDQRIHVLEQIVMNGKITFEPDSGPATT